MGRLTRSQKNDLDARLLTFDFSGLEFKLSYNIVRHFRSFVGRDFKAIAQISLYISFGRVYDTRRKGDLACLIKGKLYALYIILCTIECNYLFFYQCIL